MKLRLRGPRGGLPPGKSFTQNMLYTEYALQEFSKFQCKDFSLKITRKSLEVEIKLKLTASTDS